MTIAARFVALALTLGSTTLLAGCGDDLEGTWEGKDDSAVDLEIESADNGYTGEGHIYLCNDSDCFLCAFDFDAREAGDDRWKIDGTFKDDCSSAGPFEGVECALQNDGDELSCEVPGGVTIEYAKQD